MQSLTKTRFHTGACSGQPVFELKSLNCFHPDTVMEGLNSVSDNYEIIWIVNGSGTFSININSWPIADGAVFCIRPGSPFHCQATTGLQGYYLSFNDAFLGITAPGNEAEFTSSLIRMFRYIRGANVAEDLAAELQVVADRIAEEYSNELPLKNMMLRMYLNAFLIGLSRRFEAEFVCTYKSRDITLVERFLGLLKKEVNVKLMVCDYASQLAVTSNYLNSIVKKHTGYSCGYHIRQCIILEVKRMVKYTDVCTKEIAWYLGFTDMAHFSKFFKQNAGLNFSVFRKQTMVAESVITMDY